jgi:CHAT domain-containing protein
MTLFYQNFRSGKSKAESLRLAQLALINSEDRRKFEVRGLKKTETGNLQTDPMHPYFWAPFVLIGE